jgi:hypothetical protein
MAGAVMDDGDNETTDEDMIGGREEVGELREVWLKARRGSGDQPERQGRCATCSLLDTRRRQKGCQIRGEKRGQSASHEARCWRCACTTEHDMRWSESSTASISYSFNKPWQVFGQKEPEESPV